MTKARIHRLNQAISKAVILARPSDRYALGLIIEEIIEMESDEKASLLNFKLLAEIEALKDADLNKTLEIALLNQRMGYLGKAA